MVKASAVVILLVIAVAYAGGSFLLYRGRAQRDALLFDSDALVFYIPTIAALVANACVIWRLLAGRTSMSVRIVETLGLATLATLAVAFCWTFAALNLLGA